MAGPKTETNGQIVPRKSGPATLDQLLERMKPEIARALPRHVNPDRMARIALTALRTTPKLAQCTPESFLGCIVQAAQLGLEVNTPLGQGYLLPFEDRKRGVVQCQLIVGYQGFMDLARRSGMVKAIYAFAVYERDRFSWRLGLDPSIEHEPSTEEDRGKLTYVYAVAKLEGGEPIFTVLSRSEVERYRARSRASSNGPWVTDFEAMALKTAIRRLFRWLPKSAEMARASELDEAPETGRSQLAVADENVIGLLQAQGLPVDEPPANPDGEPVPESNPANAAPTERERVPGEDG